MTYEHHPSEELRSKSIGQAISSFPESNGVATTRLWPDFNVTRASRSMTAPIWRRNYSMAGPAPSGSRGAARNWPGSIGAWRVLWFFAPQGRLILADQRRPRKSSRPQRQLRQALRLHADTLAQQGLDLSLLEKAPHLDVLRLSSARPLLLEFDRTPLSESFREALVPVETTRR